MQERPVIAHCTVAEIQIKRPKTSYLTNHTENLAQIK